MNLNEDRKAPLREKDLSTKREMVVQYISATAKSVSDVCQSRRVLWRLMSWLNTCYGLSAITHQSPEWVSPDPLLHGLLCHLLSLPPLAPSTLHAWLPHFWLHFLLNLTPAFLFIFFFNQSVVKCCQIEIVALHLITNSLGHSWNLRWMMMVLCPSLRLFLVVCLRAWGCFCVLSGCCALPYCLLWYNCMDCSFLIRYFWQS